MIHTYVDKTRATREQCNCLGWEYAVTSGENHSWAWIAALRR